MDEPVEGEEDPPQPDTATPKQVGGAVLAPRLREHSEAEFDEAARKLKFSGKSLIRMVVGVDGRPRRIRIDSPVGIGLDEEAVHAVSRYLFAPATQDGKPVPVEVAIEVSFQIF